MKQPRRFSGLRSDCYRPRILRVLRAAPSSLTLEEIATKVRCSAVTVRRAVKALSESGQIECVGRRQRISEKGFPLPSKGPHLYAVTVKK